jgi:hypothetical protein
MGLERYCAYLRHDTREDKYLREEYLAIQAVLRHKGYPGNLSVELGDEREKWDARVDGTDLFEVTQAPPANEHVIRRAVGRAAGRELAPEGRGRVPGRARTGRWDVGVRCLLAALLDGRGVAPEA